MKRAVARISEGRTRESVADEYARYLHEESVKKLRANTHHLLQDAQYLLELPPHVKHFDIVFDE